MNQFINSRNKRNGWIKTTVIVVVLFLLIGVLNLFSAQIRNFFYSITSPIQKVFSSFGYNTASVAGSIFNYKSISRENEILKNENQRLLAQMSNLQDISEQTQAVKDILACSEQEDFNLVLTNIIGLDSKEDFIIIDKGKDDGISENMPVISQEKVLYGKVYRVYKNFSQVMLISNKNSILDVQVSQFNLDSDDDTVEENKNLSNVYGVIKGSGNLSLYLDLIPIDSQIKPEDLLVTSALEGIFPKNLTIGKIKTINKNDLKPFQTAMVESFFNVKKNDNLFIITD